MRYRSKKAANNSTLNYTSNDDKVIEEKEVLTDLGITMSNDATFDQHILSMREKIMKKTGWALRTFRTRERLPMMTIWKSLVMPYHDYCSQLWSPIKTGMIQSIEPNSFNDLSFPRSEVSINCHTGNSLNPSNCIRWNAGESDTSSFMCGKSSKVSLQISRPLQFKLHQILAIDVAGCAVSLLSQGGRPDQFRLFELRF